MLKKITLAVLAASAVTSVYAQDANTQAADQSVQAQIAELKKEIAALQSSQEAITSSVNANTNRVQGVGTGSAEHDDNHGITVPTNTGQIQNFLFSDIHDDVIPMGMLSSSQFALGILKQRNQYSDRALVFGGYLEADPQVWNGSPITYQSGSNPTTYSTYQSGKGLPITTATLYIAGNLGHYVTVETSLATNTSDGYRVKMDDAFVMFGNLDDFPLYATIGKNRLPLGSFSGGGPWTGSLTQMLFRPGRVNNASLAYYKDGLSSNFTLFQTDDHTSDFVYAAFYGASTGKWSYGINGGYVYNVNGTGNTSFDLATKTPTSKTRIGALNFDASLNYDIYGVGAGWAQTTNKADMTNNGYAGAWYVQAAFSPEIYGRSTNFNLSYNGAYNTNNLPITLSGSAQNSYSTTSGATVSGSASSVVYPGSGVDKMIIASAQRPFFTENVLIGLEYAYMHMYNSQHTNAYTLDISVYF